MAAVDNLLVPLIFLSALGCGTIGGVFFAFSSFVMKALSRLPAPEGIAAMQSINIVVLNPVFLSVFMGTAAACLIAVILSVLRWDQPGAVYWLAGGVLYLIGTFLVTVVCNVPRNDALAVLVPSDPESARLWAGYMSSWTAWNHVRAIAALAAAASFTLGLRH